MADDDLDLNALSDEELTEQMWDDLYDGLADAIEEGVRILLDRGWTPYDVLTKALVEGMRIVGNVGIPADILHFAVVTAVSMALASLSYVVVEKPFLDLKRILKARSEPPAEVSA